MIRSTERKTLNPRSVQAATILLRDPREHGSRGFRQTRRKKETPNGLVSNWSRTEMTFAATIEQEKRHDRGSDAEGGQNRAKRETEL